MFHVHLLYGQTSPPEDVSDFWNVIIPSPTRLRTHTHACAHASSHRVTCGLVGCMTRLSSRGRSMLVTICGIAINIFLLLQRSWEKCTIGYVEMEPFFKCDYDAPSHSQANVKVVGPHISHLQSSLSVTLNLIAVIHLKLSPMLMFPLADAKVQEDFSISGGLTVAGKNTPWVCLGENGVCRCGSGRSY